VAAFRIVCEALTNAYRHGNARHCSIRLLRNGVLQIEVADDGAGLPERYRAGVGLASMRERADELGGSLQLESPPEGGTRVRATLPLPR
jgi:two-component system NarL family sensor kinase